MLADVLSRLEKQEMGDVDATRAGVEAVFDISWQSLDPAIQQLGCLLSVFAPAPISQTLLAKVIEAAGVAIPEDALASSCDTLIQRYLLQRVDGQTYMLHDLIRELFQAKLDQLPQADDLKRGFCQVMVLLSQDVPQTPNLNEIATIAPTIPHIEEAATTLKEWLVDGDLSWLSVALMRFYRGQRTYDQAALWREQCMDKVTKRQISRFWHNCLVLGVGLFTLLCVSVRRLGRLVGLFVGLMRPNNPIIVSQLIAFLPEECVAELYVLERRMKKSKCSAWEIRWELFQQVVCLFWAYYIQIPLENLWLPPGDQHIDD